jgi:hypothetical protein
LEPVPRIKRVFVHGHSRALSFFGRVELDEDIPVLRPLANQASSTFEW